MIQRSVFQAVEIEVVFCGSCKVLWANLRRKVVCSMDCCKFTKHRETPVVVPIDCPVLKTRVSGTVPCEQVTYVLALEHDLFSVETFCVMCLNPVCPAKSCPNAGQTNCSWFARRCFPKKNEPFLSVLGLRIPPFFFEMLLHSPVF